MKNFFLALSIATVATGATCMGVGVNAMSNFDKSTKTLSNETAVNLFLGGLVGAHLAAAPLMVASRID